MLGHFKKSASIFTNQETQMVGNDWWPATICNNERWSEVKWYGAMFTCMNACAVHIEETQSRHWLIHTSIETNNCKKREY